MGQRLSRQENLHQRRTSSDLSIKIDSEVNKSVEELNNSNNCLITENKSVVITIRMIKMEPITNTTAGQSDNSNMDEKIDGQLNLCNNLNNNKFSSSSLNKLNNLNICDQQSNNDHILETTATATPTTKNSELNNLLNNNDSIIKNDLNKLNSCVNYNKLNNLNFNIMDERFNHLRLRNNYDDDFKPQSVINSFNLQNNNNCNSAASSSSNTNLTTNTFNIPNYGCGGSVSVVDKDTIHNKCDVIEGTSQNLQCSHINCRRKTISSLGQSKKSLCKVCRSSSFVDTTTTTTDQSTKDSTGKQKKNNWSTKLMCAKLKGSKSNSIPSTSSGIGTSSSTAGDVENSDSCICTSYRKSKDEQQNTISASSQTTEIMGPVAAVASTETSIINTPTPAALIHQNGQIIRTAIERTAFYGSGNAQLIVLSMNHEFQRFNNEEMPIEDCDERARLQRALEIDEGVDPPPGYMPSNPTLNPTNWTIVNNAALQNILQNRIILQNNCELYLPPTEDTPRIHSQVDYIHCLVPDLEKITSCGFYWGKMDRYEAERLLDQKPEGTFLLRDSAQDDYLFSVSFRKYGRSLHARIEQFNHKFSFDSHDPGVFTANTVTGLLEHYKDPTCVMFFEPMLTIPLNRNFSFSLQQLCRAAIVTNTTYDAVNDLSLPKTLKAYLKEYHYKQRVRVRKYEEHHCSNS